MRTVRIGAGAGYAGDRVEPAVELAEKGDLDYLAFECLAERTIALAQLERARDPARGFDPLLVARMRAVLGTCRENGVRIVTNAGAANPLGGAEAVREVARELGLRGLKVAAVTGDDVLEVARRADLRVEETGGTLADLGDRVVSANAYVGLGPIVEALSGGADVVITGRASDTALFMGPLVHAFGWRHDDWVRLGRGALVGHLLECAGQITGGYFADPGFKDVPDLARLGFPIGEVDEEGSLVVTKVRGSGGRVTEATCKEQLLYEIDDPARYLTPDVAADFAGVKVAEVGPDRVSVHGATGRPRPESLKVSIGYRDGYVGEGQISYAGPGAVARGRLALQIVAERLKLTRVRARETRFELIGVDALHGPALSATGHEPWEVRARVVARTDSHEEAARIGNEVETLYTNGPAGGGGSTRHVREVIGVATAFLPRTQVETRVRFQEA
ncbi:MAG TPA: acyclic terpene utilization AtuA family protein [Vicinamibacteria bacterium]